MIAFQQCIIAAGSEPAMIPGLPDDPRIIDSSGALELEDMPKRMLVIGGGIIGLEMATVYDALGVQVSVVELTKQLVPGCDPDLVRVLDLLDARGVGQAIVSSSRNAGRVLAAAGLADRFPVVVDGLTAADEELPGKPAPDMFLRAASALGVEPASCVVVEDAVAGVEAGVAGGFGFVLGVDRGGNRAALRQAGHETPTRGTR